MAVYTTLPDAELAALLAEYDLGDLRACDGIAAGVENSNFALTTARGRFILTIFEKRVSSADLPFFMQIMARLAESGVEAPQPIATTAGALFTRARGKPACIVSFLDGDWPRAPSVAQCAAIGAVLARMHVALEGFELRRENMLSIAGWENLIAPRLAQAESLRAGLAESAAADMATVRAAWPDALPRGPIHADLFPDNALFVGERLTGVIDFYFACTDFLAYDLAVCLNAWCFADERDYDLARGRAMIAAYESVRALSTTEREALPILCKGAALRFFATRLADWFDTPAGALVKKKDPLEYADKLAFHKTAASAADYGA